MKCSVPGPCRTARSGWPTLSIQSSIMFTAFLTKSVLARAILRGGCGPLSADDRVCLDYRFPTCSVNAELQTSNVHTHSRPQVAERLLHFFGEALRDNDHALAIVQSNAIGERGARSQVVCRFERKRISVDVYGAVSSEPALSSIGAGQLN